MRSEMMSQFMSGAAPIALDPTKAMPPAAMLQAVTKAGGYTSALKAAGKSLFEGETEGFADANDDQGKLRTPEAQALHLSLRGHYLRELEKQATNRKEMETDEALYDHEHWDARDAAVLNARGQVPLTFNVTKTSVDWLLGNQRRRPLEYKIMPRKKEGRAHAEIKNQIMKYLSDVSDGPMHMSRAFAEQIKAGIGWLECGVQDEDAGEIIYERFESWRNIIPDTSAQELDFSDGRYLFRVKWTDTDRALAMFPKSRATIIAASDRMFDPRGLGFMNTGDDPMDSQELVHQQDLGNYGNEYASRRRVRLYEAWFRKPMEERYLKSGDFSGEIYDPYSDGHNWSLLSQPRVEIVSKVRERMMLAVFVETGLLWISRSPYRHNQFPFTPLWGYRRARDGMPYGLIRGVRDIQFDMNKRASKALWHVTAKRIMIQTGSVADIEQLREEASRPDAVIEYNPGFPAPQIDSDLQHAAAQMDMMARDAAMIETISGVTNENMGRPQSGAQSGKAIMALQDQGDLTTNVFFENHRYGCKKHGEKMLSLVEQFMSDEKTFRVTDARGNPKYVPINDDSDDDNWITRTKADFIVSQTDYKASTRQGNFMALMEFTGTLAASAPQVAMAMLDLLVEQADLPNSAEIVKRIREITGYADPDEDPDNPSPETQAMNEGKAQQAQMKQRAAEAELGEKEAKADEIRARTAKIGVDIASARSARESAEIDKMGKAMQEAINMMGLDVVAAAADQLLRHASQVAATYEDQAPAPPGPIPPVPPPVPPLEPMQQPIAQPAPVQ